jgi:hypothetical protein
MARRSAPRYDHPADIAGGMMPAGVARSLGAIDNAAHDTRRLLTSPGP